MDKNILARAMSRPDSLEYYRCKGLKIRSERLEPREGRASLNHLIGQGLSQQCNTRFIGSKISLDTRITRLANSLSSFATLHKTYETMDKPRIWLDMYKRHQSPHQCGSSVKVKCWESDGISHCDCERRWRHFLWWSVLLLVVPMGTTLASVEPKQVVKRPIHVRVWPVRGWARLTTSPLLTRTAVGGAQLTTISLLAQLTTSSLLAHTCVKGTGQALVSTLQPMSSYRRQSRAECVRGTLATMPHQFGLPAMAHSVQQSPPSPPLVFDRYNSIMYRPEEQRLTREAMER
uniref:Uncharacterized protein n=1 Tax=Timema douglasi TaxID=61478 RepID=A0A7R8VTK3_TIMDO|nr:unnamed protein product [Timema douglasi]